MVDPKKSVGQPFLDYRDRRAGVGPPIDLTGDVRADMDQIRDFYAASGCQGKLPERVGPIRLREEEDALEAGAFSASAARSQPTPVPVAPPAGG